MTSPKPLTYVSLKCVMQYLNANSRIELQKCPTIANVEKSFPLKIDNLLLEPFEITVNHTSYKLGVIRRYRDKDTPILFPDENASGGFQCDVDRFGVEDRHFGRRNNVLEFYENELKRVKGYAHLMSNDREEKIKNIEEKRIPFLLRRRDCQPPFSHFIQLTTESHGNRRIEVLEYDGKIEKAMKYLLEKLLKGRRHVIQVNQFVIHHDSCFPSLSEIKFFAKDLKFKKRRFLSGEWLDAKSVEKKKKPCGKQCKCLLNIEVEPKTKEAPAEEVPLPERIANLFN